jgi:hypothetical protein
LATWDDFRSRLVPCIDMVKAKQAARDSALDSRAER